MDFSRMVVKERYLLYPNFLPAENGLVAWGVFVYFDSCHQSFGKCSLFSFNLCGDEFSFAAHCNRFLKDIVIREVNFYHPAVNPAGICELWWGCFTDIYEA